MLKAVSGASLTLQIGNSNVLQLTPSQALFSLPLYLSLSLGAQGIDLNGTKILNCYSLTSYPNTNLIFNYLSGVNVLPKITLTATTTQITDGLLINSGGIDMNNNDIINIKMLKSVVGSDLILQRGTTTILQLTSSESIFSLPVVISSSLGLGTVGINMNSTKIINVYSLTSYANNNLIFNYLSGVNVLPKITLTSTTTQITDGLIINSGGINMNTYSITNCPILHAGTTISLRIATTTIMQIQALKVLMSMPIDMGGKLINVMANGVLSTDAATKGQMDTADLLKMDKANGVGTGQMTLTHTASSLKLVSTLSQGNLILQNPIGSLIDFWNGSGTPIASITSNNAGSYLNFSVGATIGTGLRITNTSINCNLPTNITGNLNISSGELNMNNNTITNTSNIHSFGTNPIYLTNNNVAKVKIDASGITMQNSGNINLLGNNILNVNYIDSNGTTPLYFANSGVSICQVDSSGFVMSSQKNINMNGSNINYLANSIASSDAVNRYEISNSLIPLANWRSGETIQTVLKGSELGQLKNNSSIGAGYIGGMTYPLSIFYSFSFTPKSPTSMIYATFDGSYNATGTNTNDMFKSFIGTTIAGTSTSRMLHDCLTGGFGLRGVSCFPIHACWNNTTTTAYTIGCYFDLQGSDDYLTFNTQFSVKIEEIKI